MPTKLQRWLDIIAYLVGRRLPVSADELMRAVPAFAERWESDDPTKHASVRRTFERDKDELRTLGIPLRTVKYSRGDEPDVQEGYIIDRRDFYMPYLKLVHEATGRVGYAVRSRIADVEIAEDDAPLALSALRRISEVPGFPLAREARSAFRKLAFDLDPHAFESRSAVLFMEPPGSAELSDRLRTLSDALLARKRVTFRYHGIYRGEETSREVEGYGLLFQHGNWYLIGRDDSRDGIRVFRVGRMEDVAPNTRTPNTADYETPPDFRLGDYVGREAWELGEDDGAAMTARVRFRFPLSLWAERNEHGTLESRGSDGSAVRVFTVHQVNPFLRWLLTLQGEADVLEPQALKDELRAVARGIADAHGAADDARAGKGTASADRDSGFEDA
ncbi:MAG TPA: WYL domain-containing protein [Longimicrobiales bacterium]|nr:WYL domain-containing protein [Longimicrobiales bacterium]